MVPDYLVGKVCVQTHSRCQCDRHIREETEQEGGNPRNGRRCCYKRSIEICIVISS
jgi:hypothetical protein